MEGVELTKGTQGWWVAEGTLGASHRVNTHLASPLLCEEIALMLTTIIYLTALKVSLISIPNEYKHFIPEPPPSNILLLILYSLARPGVGDSVTDKYC